MNVFVTTPCPNESAEVLPDKHIVKMPLETCQMLAVVYSKWYFNWGNELLPKKDGTPYNTEKGAFRGHPCTIWAAESLVNTAWLIQHGMALLEEHTKRYGKVHSCQTAMNAAEEVFEKKTGKTLLCHKEVKGFARAMPEEWKFDNTIDTFTAYKRYIASKPWVKDNYLRIPNRKPEWVDTLGDTNESR